MKCYVDIKVSSAMSIPRWSSGYDSALSQPRAGFDSPSGKTSLFGVGSRQLFCLSEAPLIPFTPFAPSITRSSSLLLAALALSL